MNMIANNEPVIEDLVLSKEELEEFNAKLKLAAGWGKTRHEIIKKYYGNICRVCGGIPSKLIKHEIEDAVVLERYCEKHFVLLTDTSGKNNNFAIREKNSQDRD